MGMNYYLEQNENDVGMTVTYHIGKQSFGWRFLFRKTPLWANVSQLRGHLCTGNIRTEDGEYIDKNDFLDMIYETKDKKKQDPIELDGYSIFDEELGQHFTFSTRSFS
jgi:hypothetical protein